MTCTSTDKLPTELVDFKYAINANNPEVETKFYLFQSDLTWTVYNQCDKCFIERFALDPLASVKMF